MYFYNIYFNWSFSMKKLLIFFIGCLFSSSIYCMDIWQAIKQGDNARVQELIAQQPWIINSTNFNYNTPLHEAASGGKAEIVRTLIAAHADVNWAAGFTHETPLHSAAHQDNADIAQALLDGGALVDTQNRVYDLYTGGSTALHIATALGNKHTMQTLLANGATIDIQDNSGFTPLHDAVMPKEYGRKPDIEVAQILLNNHARTDLRTNDHGQVTPSELAMSYGNNEIAHLIRASDPNYKEMETLLQARQPRLGASITPAMKDLPIFIYQDIFNSLKKDRR